MDFCLTHETLLDGCVLTTGLLKPALKHKFPSISQSESGRDTPSTNQASSINGTDDEKISHVGPEAALLQSENERLKSAVEQR